MSNFLLQNAQRLHQAGNLAEAARLYGEVLRIDPGQFEARYALGVLHYQAGRHDEAERLIADAPRHVNLNGPTIIESGTRLEVLAPGLSRMGHEVRTAPFDSGVNGISRVGDGYEGGADPRREGVALGD